MDIKDLAKESDGHPDTWAKGLLEMLEKDKDHYVEMKEVLYGQGTVCCRKNV